MIFMLMVPFVSCDGRDSSRAKKHCLCIKYAKQIREAQPRSDFAVDAVARALSKSFELAGLTGAVVF
jgi:hypothetical protein